MTINEANLLLTLFYTQHKGKRLCDVFSSISFECLIDRMDNDDDGIKSIIFDGDSDGCSIYHPYLDPKFMVMYYDEKIINDKICKVYTFLNINIFDYISFEDLI